MIAIIKLTSQETLLARQIYRSNDKITLVDPLEMKFYSDHSGPLMHSTFWIPLTDEEINVDIDMSHVILSIKAPKDLEKFYHKSLDKIKNGDSEEDKKEFEKKVKDAIKQFTKKTSNTSSWTIH